MNDKAEKPKLKLINKAFQNVKYNYLISKRELPILNYHQIQNLVFNHLKKSKTQIIYIIQLIRIQFQNMLF